VVNKKSIFQKSLIIAIVISEVRKTNYVQKNWIWLIWIAFTTYAFVFAPPDSPEKTITLITNLSTGKIADINPLIVALFYIMGVWPLIYSCVLFADGRGRKYLHGYLPLYPLASAPLPCCLI
jgi:hypothetical protein